MKRIQAYLLVLVLIMTMSGVSAMASGTITVELSKTRAKAGDSVVVSGEADANSWVSIKVVDASDNIAYFNAFTSDASGNYNHTFKVSSRGAQIVTIVVGSGTDIASASLTIYEASDDDGDHGGDDNNGGDIVIENPNINGDNGKIDIEISSDDMEEALEEAEENEEGKKVVSIDIQDDGLASGYEIGLPIAMLQFGDELEISINTADASIELPGNMLSDGQTGDVNLGFESIDFTDETVRDELEERFPNIDDETLDKIGSRPVFEISLTVDDETYDWESDEDPVTIAIPYTLQEGEDPEHIVVWYIDGEGNATSVTNGKYDEATGEVVFEVYHFSTYGIAYVEITFDDLDSYGWARDEIEVLASKGIINGTGNNMYSPSNDITRADFLTLLVRTLELSADFDTNFDDVEESAYYYEAVGIGKTLGITKGVGNNEFNPRSPITREDMMVMTYKSLVVSGIALEEIAGTELEAFIDGDEIAAYANESACVLVNKGLIVGSEDSLDPKDYTTRAEMAVLIYRIYNMQ